MTTYNGADFVAESIESVLNQTFEDFELLIIDDYSSDETVSVINRFCDKRIRLVRNEQNLGVCGARNRGIELACGKYYAANDHDDLSLPMRLERQVTYLDANPDTVLVATLGKSLGNGKPMDADDARIAKPHIFDFLLFTRNPIMHSSIMMRTQTLKEYKLRYRDEFRYADDFDLYHRLLGFGRLHCLDEILAVYRRHEKNTYLHNRREMTRNGASVLQTAYVSLLGERLDKDEIASMLYVLSGSPASTRERLTAIGKLLARILTAIERRHQLSAAKLEELQRFASEMWWNAVCQTAKRHGLGSLAEFRRNPGLAMMPPSLRPLPKTILLGSYRSIFGAGKYRGPITQE